MRGVALECLGVFQSVRILGGNICGHWNVWFWVHDARNLVSGSIRVGDVWVLRHWDAVMCGVLGDGDWDIGVSGQWDAKGWALSDDGEKDCR